MTQDDSARFGVEVWGRIREAFEGRNPAQIAAELGVKKQSAYKWSKGGLPSIETIVRIAEVTQSSLEWLLTGQGDRRRVQGQTSIPRRTGSIERLAVNNPERRLALFELDAAIGKLIEAVVEQVEEEAEKRADRSGVKNITIGGGEKKRMKG